MTKDEIEKLVLEIAEELHCGPESNLLIRDVTNNTIYLTLKYLAQRGLIGAGVPDGYVFLSKASIKKLGGLIPCSPGGTFENDPADAIVDAACRAITIMPVLHPTTKMLEAGKRALDDALSSGNDVHDHAHAAIVYKAMLAAAPKHDGGV